MREDVSFLEGILFESMFKEIEERYRDVIEFRSDHYEMVNIAEHLMKITKQVERIFKEIPNPQKKLDEALYTTLYEALKDISGILYDFSIAEQEQTNYVLVKTYRKLDNLHTLFTKLKI
jgi:hypothetical protein